MLTMMDQHVLSYFNKWRILRLSVLTTLPPGANLPPTPSSYVEDVGLQPDTFLELGSTTLGSHSSRVWNTTTRVRCKSDDGVRAYVQY